MKFSLLILFFTATATYGQDTLKLIQKSRNVITIAITESYTPRVEIFDTLVKRQTAEAIRELYKTGWTKEDIQAIMRVELLPSKIAFINQGVPSKKSEKSPQYAHLSKDTAVYDWIELGYKYCQARTADIFARAKKADAKAVKSDYNPWVRIIVDESLGYKIADIRKELKKRRIDRYFIELRNKPAVIREDHFFDEPVAPPPPEMRDDGIIDVVEEPASFPGGNEALKKYIEKTLIYPASAKENGIEGKVYLKFVVDKTGQISDIMAVKKMPDCPECDMQAIRVFKSMPKWIPAKNEGKPVDSHFTYPVVFKLQ